MSKLEKTIEQMRSNPAGVRFDDLIRVCTAVFGKPERKVGSHRKFRTSGARPLIVQPGRNGMAKPYQVKQILRQLDTQESEK
jgi:predicted RNA binding protein YcfA (HicA-like mRNA interferase family)